MKTVFILLLATAIFNFSNAQESFRVVTRVVDAYPSLSPDLEHLIFCSNRTGEYQIYQCNKEGSELVQLTNSKGGSFSPVWSPDGEKIVFASERDKDSEIYIMNADGTEQKRLTTQQGDDSHPKFSPDGKKIIFCSVRTSPDLSIPWTQQYNEIFTMNIDGSDVKQITDFKMISTYPDFSPDGKKIVFRMITKEPGLNWSQQPMKLNSEVFVMNSDGTNPINLSNDKSFDGWPCWLNSETVLFTSNRGGEINKGQLYSVKTDGTMLAKLTDNKNSFIQASVTKDHKTIYAQRNWETEMYEYGHIVEISTNEF